MPGLFTIILFSLAALAAVAALVPRACRLAVRYRFVDRPGGRKGHKGAVPPVGGLVVFPVFIIFSLIAGVALPGFYAFLLALCLLLLVGAADDRAAVPAGLKFLAQFAAAILAVVGGAAVLSQLGDLFGFGTVGLGWGRVIFSVIATVLLINAINLMDGLDGLAGGKGFIALFWLLVCALLSGQSAFLLPLGVLMGALAGFLIYNLRHPLRDRAAVFLGDAGSLTLGLALAWFALKMTETSGRQIEPITIAWILALPIMDTCGQFARRVSEGRHPFDADQNHFHHHFINVGMAPGRATALILGLTFITGLIGVGGAALGVPVPVLAYSWSALLLLHIYLSLKPERMRGLIARLHREDTGDKN